MHHPTVVLDGRTWTVIATNQNGVTVTKDGAVRFVKHEEVR